MGDYKSPTTIPPIYPGTIETALDFEVYIIKQAPLINWMQTFPTEDMKNDHVDGYCICKAQSQSKREKNR